MWTSRLFPKKQQPLKDIFQNSSSSTLPTKSPFDIVHQQKERYNQVQLVQVEDRVPPIEINQQDQIEIKGAAGAGSSKNHLPNFRISSENTKTYLEGSNSESQWSEGEGLLIVQMGKVRKGKRGSATRKWISVRRRPSLKRQPDVLGTSLQPSSGDGAADTTDDSIIIVSPTDSPCAGDHSRSVDGLDSGGGHYKSPIKPRTDKSATTNRTRLYDSSATSTRSSNDTIDLVDDDDDPLMDPDHRPDLYLPNPQHHEMKMKPIVNDVIVLSDEESNGDLLEAAIRTKSTSAPEANDSPTENDCEIIAVKVVAANKQSSPRRAVRKSPGNKAFLGGRRNSLSFNSVKLSVDRARKRISSVNLARPSVMSHGIRKKKQKKNKKGKGKGGQGQGPNVLRNKTRPEFEFVTPVSLRKNNSKARPPRRSTSPVFLLDKELGPGKSNFGPRFSQLPSTSWGIKAPTFIPVGGGGTGIRGPFNFSMQIRQPSQQPVIPAAPNFISVSTNENRVPGSLRPIVVDGSNVAMGHKGDRTFSCRGIQICVEFFKRRGHEVVACVPQFRRRHSESVDTNILETMEKEGTVKFTPSREVGGHRIASYDDRFIVQYAHMKDAVIISNDNFKDIYNEEPEWRDTLRFRILQFTWMDESCIMFPRDPMGRNGPDLEQFLRF